jgi:hypothetical protein
LEPPPETRGQGANVAEDENTDLESARIGLLDQVDDQPLETAVLEVGHRVEHPDESTCGYRHQ